ncbi:hypothetical protein SteCoe_16840 [Stentor coeruleus]|uniref:Uncharacterized protein n=1 Tax=Stentor coeruleus TaxID=5963 RepID=A0A1R2C0E2_9CILI|nr:hypothetical protein SteCoe_16840 [Stentor coeruleus]
MEVKENTSGEHIQDSHAGISIELENQSERKRLDVPLGFAENAKSTFASDFSDINDKSRNNSDFHETVNKYQLPTYYGARIMNKSQDKKDELIIQYKCDCILF